MNDFKNISKVICCLLVFLFCFYFFYFKLSPSDQELKEETLEMCVPLQYDFRIISYYADRYYNFEGRTREGKIVKFKLPRHWRLENLCSDGDSIHKLAGEKELYLIKRDTVIKLPLLVHGEGI